MKALEDFKTMIKTLLFGEGAHKGMVGQVVKQEEEIDKIKTAMVSIRDDVKTMKTIAYVIVGAVVTGALTLIIKLFYP